MADTICRAFTFVNYHIPISATKGTDVPYITLGFFDGMYTEYLGIDYAIEGWRPLWEYTIKSFLYTLNRSRD